MPIKFYPIYRLVLLYDKLGATPTALKYAHKITDMKVKIESEIVGNIREEMVEHIKQHSPQATN